MKIIIDAYAWIEYLDGSESGLKIKEFLEKENELFTLTLTIAEVISRAVRVGADTSTAYNAIAYNSNIIDINRDIAREAGLIHAKIKKEIKDFGLIDSFLLAVANKIGAKIITGDKHFKGIKNVIFIK